MTEQLIFQMVIASILVCIGGVFHGEKETIMNNQTGIGLKKSSWFPNWNWWNNNNWHYNNIIIQWLMRYPLSFMKDGYHFTGTVGSIFLYAGVAIAAGASPIEIVYIIIGAYIAQGIGFNFSYH